MTKCGVTWNKLNCVSDKKVSHCQQKTFQDTVIVSCPTPRKSLGKQMCLAAFWDGHPGRARGIGARAPQGRRIASSCLIDRLPHSSSGIPDTLSCHSLTWSRGESNEQILKASYKKKKGQKDLLPQKSVCSTCRSLFLLALFFTISPWFYIYHFKIFLQEVNEESRFPHESYPVIPLFSQKVKLYMCSEQQHHVMCKGSRS